jgi:flavodoxin I
MSKINIIFSSIGGNTLLVVQKIAQILEKNSEQNPVPVEVNMYRVDNCDPAVINNCDCVILASPTYGQGTLEEHFPSFLKKIASEVEGKKFAVVGLGDNRYYPEYLTESGGILEEFVKNNNGQLLVPALRIGMPPIKFIDKLVPKWVEKLVVEMGK